MRHELIAGTQPGFPAPLTDGKGRAAAVPGRHQAHNAERAEASDPRPITIREFFNKNRGGTGRASLGSSCWIQQHGPLLLLHSPKGTRLLSDQDDLAVALRAVSLAEGRREPDDGELETSAAHAPATAQSSDFVLGMLILAALGLLVGSVWIGKPIVTRYFTQSSAVRTDPDPSTPVAAMEVQTPEAGLVVPVFEARSIRCEWGQGTQADWDAGKLSLKQGTFGRDAAVTFDSIDIQKRTARIVGNVG
jgi:hypothetical protein